MIGKAEPIKVKAFKGPVIEEQQHKRERHQHGFSHEAQCKKEKHWQKRPCPLAFSIASIGPKGKHPEEGAQNILAFRYPCHRLNMEGMEREQSGNKAAFPHLAGHAPKHDKKEQGIAHVKKKACQMMLAWL